MSGHRKKGRRRLSEADRKIWAQVAATTRPLEDNRSSTPVPRETDHPSGKQRDLPQVSGEFHPAKTPLVTVDRSPKVGRIGSPEPGVDRRTSQRILRGARAPEARIDLHGMTSARAHAACLGFLSDCLSRGLRFVLVITGKGARGPERGFFEPRRGILREQLPGWLRASPLRGHIIGIYEAHQRHGGRGAFYIYLKRRR